MHAAITNGVTGEEIGLDPQGNLLGSLRQHLMDMASNHGVLTTVQNAAQLVLQTGWPLLLPTVEGRAKSLTDIVKDTGDKFFALVIVLYNVTYNHIFLF